MRCNVPTEGEAEWRINLEEREIVVERTDERNNVRVTYLVFFQMDIKIRPIRKEEDRVHNYQLPEDDVFAHLERSLICSSRKVINLLI